MSDIIETTDDKVLTVFPVGQLSIIATADKSGDGLLSALAAKIADFVPDISTAKGRDAIRSLAYEVSTTGASLDKLAFGMTEEWRKAKAAVDAERRVLKERIKALHGEVRGQLTEWEQRDERRVDAHEALLAEIARVGQSVAERWDSLPLEEMRASLDGLQGHATREWEEFANRASYAIATARDQLNAAIARRVKADNDAAELALFREHAAEQQRLEQARLQAKHLRLATETAARVAREEAEAAAERRRQEDAAAAQAEQARLAREADAARKREAEAVRLAAEAEDRRLAAAAQAKRDAEAARVQAEADRKAEAAVAEARQAAAVEQARAQAAHEAEQARLAEVERQRQADAAAEFERSEAARLAADAADAARVKAENKVWRAGINTAAASALVAKVPSLKDAQAKAIVTAIAKGEVPAVSISY